ncbi:MAG: hypothetical protein ACKVII_18655 [Planctomycetales bacterium]
MKSTTAHEIRRGTIVGRIRRSRTRNGTQHTVSVIRLFRNGDHWKESTRFGGNDIPVVRLVLDEAHTWILQSSSEPQTATDRS